MMRFIIIIIIFIIIYPYFIVVFFDWIRLTIEFKRTTGMAHLRITL